MNPKTWEEMVKNTRQLESALGSAEKFIAGNEKETCVIQRRCLRAGRDIKAGEIIHRDMIDVLRPAIKGAILPNEIESVIGTRSAKDLKFGVEIRWTDLVE